MSDNDTECELAAWELLQSTRRELADANAENLEQSRLLGMSAEREADLRGGLEREKRRADGLRYEITAARDERDHYLGECNRLNYELRAERKASFREERDRLAQAIDAATVLIAAKGRHNTFLAYEGLREALAAVKDSRNTPDQPPR